MRKRQIISSSGLAVVALLAFAILVLANTTLTRFRLDLTENRLFTLSQGTINIIGSLDEPVTLDFYFSRKTLVDFPLLLNYSNRVRDLLEEYAAKSNGMIKLRVIEPEPFSEAEDQAVASGLQGIAMNAAGDRAYFGLVGTNSTDDEATIPFFQTSREAALEYDITKLVYNLANPKKSVIGVISSLTMFGGMPPAAAARPWTIIEAMREFFDVRNLGADPRTIADDVDVLMIVHPKGLSDAAMFAIDQYLLAGGKALLFVDPMAESDPAQPDPNSPFVMPDLDSDLKFLLEGWGIEVLDGKIAGDINAAMRVQTRDARGPQETSYLPWLRLVKSNFNQDDFSTNELEIINMGTAGIIKKNAESKLTFTALIQTSTGSQQIERDLILFQRDPNVMLRNFKAENEMLTLAARLSGPVTTAFPDGAPKTDDDDGNADDSNLIKEGNINVILVADTDILSDMFWVRKQNFFGIEVPQSIANNGDFVINAIDNLSGSTDLISLRSRGGFARPFEVVEQIRRQAEEQFREQEQQLQAKLEETERKITELQREGGSSDLILTPEQTAEIEKFRGEQVKTRKELRAVQHELQKNIERLGTLLKFINIALIPLLIGLAVILRVLYRARRTA